MCDCQRENNTNSSGFNYRTESFMIIKTMLLTKTFSDQPCLVTLNCPCMIPFEFIDPFSLNDIGIWGTRDQGPSVVSHKGRVLVCHSLTPLRVFVSNGKGGWFGVNKSSMSVVGGGIIWFGRFRIRTTIGRSRAWWRWVRNWWWWRWVRG